VFFVQPEPPFFFFRCFSRPSEPGSFLNPTCVCSYCARAFEPQQMLKLTSWCSIYFSFLSRRLFFPFSRFFFSEGFPLHRFAEAIFLNLVGDVPPPFRIKLWRHLFLLVFTTPKFLLRPLMVSPFLCSAYWFPLPFRPQIIVFQELEERPVIRTTWTFEELVITRAFPLPFPSFSFTRASPLFT